MRARIAISAAAVVMTLLAPAISLAGGGVVLSPSTYFYGDVMPTIPTDPVEFTVTNQSAEPAEVSILGLTDPVNFVLDPDGGGSPCGLDARTLTPGGSCTFTVVFNPKEDDIYDATLTVIGGGRELRLKLTGTATLCGC